MKLQRMCITKKQNNNNVKEHYLECLSNKQKANILNAVVSILEQYSEFADDPDTVSAKIFNRSIRKQIDRIFSTLDVQGRFSFQHLTVYLQQMKIEIIIRAKHYPYAYSVLEFQIPPYAYTHLDIAEYLILDKQRRLVQKQSWCMAHMLDQEKADEIAANIKQRRKQA